MRLIYPSAILFGVYLGTLWLAPTYAGASVAASGFVGGCLFVLALTEDLA